MSTVKIPARYVKELVANVDKYLVELGDPHWQLPKNKSDIPFVAYYAPEMENTPGLYQELAYGYKYFIGMLRWTV